MSQRLLAVKHTHLATVAMFCSHMIASSNQMPAFNPRHNHTHRLEKSKYTKDVLYVAMYICTVCNNVCTVAMSTELPFVHPAVGYRNLCTFLTEVAKTDHLLHHQSCHDLRRSKSATHSMFEQHNHSHRNNNDPK